MTLETRRFRVAAEDAAGDLVTSKRGDLDVERAATDMKHHAKHGAPRERARYYSRDLDLPRARQAQRIDDVAWNYFGGTSSDYCEDCQRILVVRWGNNTAADAPANVCY